MKFTLSTAGNFYSKDKAEKLKGLGFEFKISEVTFNYNKNYMKKDNIPTIEINTLEELMKFIKVHGSIVLDEDEITIYDDYLE